MTEHRTIKEGYQSATNSGNLAVDLEHRTTPRWSDWPTRIKDTYENPPAIGHERRLK